MPSLTGGAATVKKQLGRQAGRQASSGISSVATSAMELRPTGGVTLLCSLAMPMAAPVTSKNESCSAVLARWMSCELQQRTYVQRMSDGMGPDR